MPITRTPIVDDDGTGTTGTVLDNAWKQELYNQIDAAALSPSSRVLVHGDGHDIAAGLTNLVVTNFATGDLQKYDTILIEFECWCSAPLPPIVLAGYYPLTAGAASFLNLNSFGVPAGGQTTTVRAYIRPYRGSDGSVHLSATGGDGAIAGTMAGLVAVPTWAQAWQLYIYHQGIPAGKFLEWKSSISLIHG